MARDRPSTNTGSAKRRWGVADLPDRPFAFVAEATGIEDCFDVAAKARPGMPAERRHEASGDVGDRDGPRSLLPLRRGGEKKST